MKAAVPWIVCAAALVATLGTASTAAAQVYPTVKRHLTGPLQICDQGSFFVGGVPKITQYANSVTAGSWQELIIGQMYVQFQIPQDARKWPLIMVHGGGYTGSCLESTPDGHEGWFSYAVRNKLATYVVDQAGRGRSGFDRSFINEAIATGDLAGFPNLGNTSSSGIWTAWFGHIIPAGADIITGTMIRHGDPGDPQCVTDPEHCTYHPAQMIPPLPNTVDPNIEARVGAIGPEPNAANDSYLALQHYKWGVPNTNVTLPTLTCSTCNPTNPPPADSWSGRDLAELVEGLGGAIVATHSQSGSVGHHMVRFLKEDGQLNLLKGLITIEGSCSLTQSGLTAADFDGIPYLAFKGWYAAPSQVCVNTVAAINARGGKADYIGLDDPAYGTRFQGVTHMMMMSTKSLEVFDEILKWVNKNIKNPPAHGKCGPEGKN